MKYTIELLIQQYLLSKWYCPLPGLGTINLRMDSASHSIVDHQFHPPGWQIELISEEMALDLFVNYVAAVTLVAPKAALQHITSWVNEFLTDTTIKQKVIPGIGKLKKDQSGTVRFIQEVITVTLQPVDAKKIVRTDAVHQVLVGDTEHSSEYMNEMLQQSQKTLPVNHSWLLALIFFIMALTALAFYGFNKTALHATGGNMQKIKLHPTTETYRIVP